VEGAVIDQPFGLGGPAPVGHGCRVLARVAVETRGDDGEISGTFRSETSAKAWVESELIIKLVTARTRAGHLLGELELVASANCVRAGNRLLETVNLKMLGAFDPADSDGREAVE
jgi:hypothetical protein